MINSFKYRFILSFVTVEVFFILCIVTINFITIHESSSQLIKSNIDSTSQLMDELVKSPISVYDIATLDNITNTSNIKNVSSIIILDNQDRVISKKYNLKEPIENILSLKKDTKLKINKKEYDIKYIDINYDNVNLGYVYIIFDMSTFNSLIEENKTSTFFIILIEILISTIISYLIGYKLTSHLTKLSNSAKKLGKSKDLNVVIPCQDDKTELGVLARSLEQMKNDIKTRNNLLKNVKDVFENIKEAIIVFDENGNINLVNDAFFNITKTPNDDIKEKNIFSIEFGMSNSDLISILEYLKENDEWQNEYTLSNKYMGSKIALLNFSKIHNKERVSYILIFSDISKEKEKENLLQIQSRMATMGEMIGNIAHQWRQPLSAISSTSSGLKLQQELGILEDDYLNKSLDDIIDTTQFLSDTIEDFRDFFRTEKKVSEFRISDIFFKISSILNPLFVNKGISLEEKIIDDPLLKGFQNELTQAFINIINNAKDVLVENKEIKNKTIQLKVSLDSEQKNVDIYVIDNGGGIPNEIIGKIFEPYFTTKHQSQGTGIGLYMTHTIITKHFNGKLEVKNTSFTLNDTEYKGASFKISLPL